MRVSAHADHRTTATCVKGCGKPALPYTELRWRSITTREGLISLRFRPWRGDHLTWLHCCRYPPAIAVLLVSSAGLAGLIHYAPGHCAPYATAVSGEAIAVMACSTD